MSAIFDRGDLPIADKMLDLVDKGFATHPFQEYICFWIAFNNIYTTNSFTLGESVRLKKDNNGDVIYNPDINSNCYMPAISTISHEKDQIIKVVKETSVDFRQSLISDKNIPFFVHRFPIWDGKKIEKDIRGQKLNGVININRTIDENHPHWSPIDSTLYDQFNKKTISDDGIEKITIQIVLMLYTIRNNMFHGGKEPTEWNELYVVEHATPLLSKLVKHFIKRY